MGSDDVDGAKAGDRGAFARLVQHHRSPVWGVALAVLADAPACEEGVQEVLTTA